MGHRAKAKHLQGRASEGITCTEAPTSQEGLGSDWAHPYAPGHHILLLETHCHALFLQKFSSLTFLYNVTSES